MDGRSESGYVGLKNMTNTCYINSVMQQLYMIPEIRQAILSAPSEVKEDEEPTVLYETQRMFAALSKTDNQYFDMRVSRVVSSWM